MPTPPPPGFKKRVIGPIPPRDKHGKLMIDPVLVKDVKRNVLGEPVRDKDGNAIEIDIDSRRPLEYRLYVQGIEPRKGATDGLRLFRCEITGEDAMDPALLVWAKDERHAEKVYRSEWGITGSYGPYQQLKVAEFKE